MTLSGMENIMQALGWTLLHSFWQIGLVAILFFLLISFFPQAKPEIRYGLGVLSMILTAILSAGTFYEVYEPEKHTHYLKQQADKESVRWNYYEQLEFDEEAAKVESDWQSFISVSRHWLDQHINWLVGAWLCGIIFFTLRFGGSLLLLQRLKHRDIRPLPSHWERKMKEMQELLMIMRPVELLASGLVSAPMMIGHLKPVILVPASMLSGLSDDQLEAIIAHELAHIYRNDYWINLLQSLLEIIFFFHPAFWWISSVVKAEREKCCDDLAISLCGDSLAYAKALVRVEEMQEGTPALALSFGGKRMGLLHRIERILQPGQKPQNLKARFVALSLLLLSLLLIFSTSESQAVRYGSKKAKEALHWVKTSYLPQKIDKHIPSLSSQIPETAIQKAKPTNVEKLLPDTLPTQNSAPKAYSYNFHFDSDSIKAPLVFHLPDFSDLLTDEDAAAMYNFQLEDSVLKPLAQQMDSLSGIIMNSFDDSSFVYHLKNVRAAASPMAFDFNTMDSSLQTAIDKAFILADSAMQQQIHLSHSFTSLAAGLQDSTLEARLRELEKKMRVKEREMEALMREREREMALLFKEKAAELQQKEQQLMRQIQEQQRVLDRQMQAQERELQEQMRRQEQIFREEAAKMEAERIRMDDSISKLEALLLADALIESGKKYQLRISNDQVLVNDEALRNGLFKKYKKFLQQEDIFDFEKGDTISITRIAE
jgi:beta-lactamase regulating signal transducer with metallopeptidase domain